jgi:amidase
MVPLAHGADGLGSIRIPAAACGVVGVKPGPGMVPVDPDWWFGMVEHGPLATTVGDTALMLSVMAERPELEPTPPDRPLRIAVSTKFPRLPFPVDPEYRRATMETAERLAAAGHVVEEADPPYSQSMANGAYLRWFAGTAHTAEGLDVQRLEPRTRAHVRAGRLLGRMVKPTQQYRWRELAARFFASRDLLLTPGLARPAIPLRRGERRSWASTLWVETRFAPFAGPWNLARFPAAVVPIGRHSNGLPLGGQLVAAPGGEQLILSAARQLEDLNPWPRHAPLHA